METENFKKYYEDTYDHEFYYFDQYQYEIDPEETLDDINAYTIEKQKEEIEKCVESFTYFCHKYIKILHPTKGTNTIFIV